MSNLLDEVVYAQKHEECRGITSICSVHPWVLRAAMQGDGPFVIESTCNQVNQYGGYADMTPDGFISFVRAIAVDNGFPFEKLILGGDHLGPYVWQNEPADNAIKKSVAMVRAYVQAGYTKIHLDASMKLGDDDPHKPLNIELVARRTAWLVKAAERAFPIPEQDCTLRYVIGTEVPSPGGSITHLDSIYVTQVEDVQHMLEAMEAAFLHEGLEAAWGRVIAVVVQPGVEFGDDTILDYNPNLVCDLARFSEKTPFVYEAHSTDFQTSQCLQHLVRDHFAILKVGPALTYAFREAAFALSMIEDELISRPQCSRLIKKLDDAMQREPVYWINHYRGTEREKAHARKYSLCDRSRYYWAKPELQSAFNLLISNLKGRIIPLSLLSQFLPRHYVDIREGRIKNSVDAILMESVLRVLRDYVKACGPAPSSP